MMTRLLIALIPALWIVAIAIISIQNATAISLEFFGLRSIEIPFGVLLSVFVAGGMVLTAAVLVLLGRSGKRPKP